MKYTEDNHNAYSSYKQEGVYSLEHDEDGWYFEQLVAPSLAD